MFPEDTPLPLDRTSNGSETKRVCQLPAPVFSFNFNWKTFTTLLSFGVFCLSARGQGKYPAASGNLLPDRSTKTDTFPHTQRRLVNFYFLIFRVITAGGDEDSCTQFDCLQVLPSSFCKATHFNVMNVKSSSGSTRNQRYLQLLEWAFRIGSYLKREKQKKKDR